MIEDAGTAFAQQRPPYLAPMEPGLWRLEVWAQPGAPKSSVVGEYQGRLKVKIGAPAVDGKANQALTDYVARLLGLRKNAVNVSAGHASRRKTLTIATQDDPAWARLVPGRTSGS